MQAPEHIPSKNTKRICIAVLLVISHLGVGLNIFSVSPILTEIINDLGINHGKAGLLLSLPPLVAALFGIPGGLIAVRLGQFRGFAIGLALMSTTTLSIIMPTFIPLLMLRLIYGIGAALVLTITGPILLQWFRPKELLVLNACNAAMMTIGIGISVAGGAIIAKFLSWPTSLSTFGLIPLLVTLLWISMGRHNISQTLDRSLPRLPEIFHIIRRRTILLLLAADAGVMFQYTALSGWLPAFYYETRNMSFEFSGLLASFLPLSGIVGVALGGSLPLKFGAPRTYLIIAGALVLVAGPATYIFQNSWLTYLALLVVGAGSWFYLPTLMTETVKAARFIEKDVAIIWGALLTFTGIGMFVAPILVGYIHDVFETFILGFLICSIASSLMLIAGLCMNKRS